MEHWFRVQLGVDEMLEHYLSLLACLTKAARADESDSEADN